MRVKIVPVLSYLNPFVYYQFLLKICAPMRTVDAGLLHDGITTLSTQAASEPHLSGQKWTHYPNVQAQCTSLLAGSNVSGPPRLLLDQKRKSSEL